MNGSNITGGLSDRGRAEDDFYATNPEDVRDFLSAYGAYSSNRIEGKILEPCIGAGHIARELYKLGNVEIKGYDIKDRNSGFDTNIEDFLKADIKPIYDYVITNPPYSLAENFIRKSMFCINSHGKVIMFLKLQFLEGLGRKHLFDAFPPEYIYVHRKRAQPLRNGSKTDPKTGKKWASSTICFAWFVWDKYYTGEPKIRWI